MKAMMSLALIIGILGSANGIDFSGRVETLPNLMKLYGTKTSRIIKVSPELRNDAIFISVSNVNQAELDAKIASALGAEWKIENDIWTLFRNRPSIQSVKSTTDQRLSSIQKKLNEEAKLRNDLPPVTPELEQQNRERLRTMVGQSRNNRDIMNQMRALMGQSSAGRLGIDTMLSVSAKFYNAIAPFGRMVLASQPNQSQSALNRSIFTAAQTLADSGGGMGGGMMMGGAAMFSQTIPGQQPVERDNKLKNVWAVISREGLADNFSISLTGENAAGEVIVSTGYGFSIDTSDGLIDSTKIEISSSVTIPPDEIALLKNFNQLQNNAGNTRMMMGAQRMGARGGSFARVFGGAENSNPLLKPSVRLAREIKDIASADPLTYGHEHFLKALGNDGHDIVAVLPDSLGTTFADELLQSGYRTDNYINDLQSKAQMVVSTENSWIQISPKDVVTESTNRFDRNAFKFMMKKLLDVGRVGLDDRAEYALTAPDSISTTAFDLRIALSFSPFASYDLWNGIWDTNLPILKLYGSLSPMQKQSLRNKQSIQLGNLPIDQVRGINKYVFSTKASPNRLSNNGGIMGFFTSYNSERTTILGTSIPTDTKLRMNVSANSMALAKSSNETFSFQDPSSLATSTLISESPERLRLPAGATQNYVGFSNASSEALELVIEFTPNYGVTGQFQDYQFNLNGTFGPIASLPGEFNTQYQKALEDQRRMFSNVNFGGGMGRGNGQP